MKSLKLCNDYSNQLALELTDNLSAKLAHVRALLLVGSDADFSSYHPSVAQDFIGATLDCVEDINALIPELEAHL